MLWRVPHSIKPKLAPEVKLVSETIFLITFLAAASRVPDPPPYVAISVKLLLNFRTV